MTPIVDKLDSITTCTCMYLQEPGSWYLFWLLPPCAAGAELLLCLFVCLVCLSVNLFHFWQFTVILEDSLDQNYCKYKINRTHVLGFSTKMLQ